jgi:uncharacterized protein YciI
MKFIALFEKSGKPISDDLMARHIDHLRNLKKKDKLFFCGPFKNSNRVIQILFTGNYSEAEQIVLQDPFTSEGVFSKYTLHELIEANEENNYLSNGKTDNF